LLSRRVTPFILIVFVLMLLPSPPMIRAERPDAPPYAKRGAFPVGVREVTIPAGGAPSDYPLQATIWYPAVKAADVEETSTYRWFLLEGEGRAIENAPPEGGGAPYPLIVFSHGLSGLRYQLPSYLEHLASWGFVVIAADHPGSTFTDVQSGGRAGILNSFARRPLEIQREIVFMEGVNAEGTLKGVIDMAMIGVTGHSFGGYTTLSAGGGRLDFGGLQEQCAKATPERETACTFLESLDEIAAARGITPPNDGFFPATTDPRIRAIVPLAPSSGQIFGERGAAPITIPMMIIVGSADRATIPERDSYPVYQAVSSPEKALVVLENAGHYVFVERCTPLVIRLGLYGQCSDLVWDMDRAHDLTYHFATAFFLTTLKGDSAARAALAPSENVFTGVRYETTLKTN